MGKPYSVNFDVPSWATMGRENQRYALPRSINCVWPEAREVDELRPVLSVSDCRTLISGKASAYRILREASDPSALLVKCAFGRISFSRSFTSSARMCKQFLRPGTEAHCPSPCAFSHLFVFMFCTSKETGVNYLDI